MEQEGFTGASSHPERELAHIIIRERGDVVVGLFHEHFDTFIQVVLQCDPISEIAIKEYLGEEHRQILEILQAYGSLSLGADMIHVALDVRVVLLEL